jgi:hypothetical protein
MLILNESYKFPIKSDSDNGGRALGAPNASSVSRSILEPIEDIVDIGISAGDGAATTLVTKDDKASLGSVLAW